jgi:hypothetical protein
MTNTAFYTNKQKRAGYLLKKFGQSITIQKFNGGVYASEYLTEGLMLQYADKERDGDLIRPLDVKVMMTAANLPSPPTMQDKLVDGVSGKVYQIITASPFAPAGIPIYYDLQIRA